MKAGRSNRHGNNEEINPEYIRACVENSKCQKWNFLLRSFMHKNVKRMLT